MKISVQEMMEDILGWLRTAAPGLMAVFIIIFVVLFFSNLQFGVDSSRRVSVKALTGCKDDLTKLRQKAEQGDAKAQCALGVNYAVGKGVPQDYKDAVKWWRLAAAQGSATAQYNLGYCYYLGQGVPQDYKDAVKWLHLSAAQGVAEAQYMLGYCYYLGQGVPQDYKDAVKWWRLAAAQGGGTGTTHAGLLLL